MMDIMEVLEGLVTPELTISSQRLQDMLPPVDQTKQPEYISARLSDALRNVEFFASTAAEIYSLKRFTDVQLSMWFVENSKKIAGVLINLENNLTQYIPDENNRIQAEADIAEVRKFQDRLRRAGRMLEKSTTREVG
jgi:hypothetical protein